ncbi:disease resistance protein Pik-2-like [Phragmites australis]|uniref:disease resistance protein Pik-2-like n=1 Tax=Phragmites australis TaxID=29695 RepID=UPI002D78F080|nr:disease resistance protein Pik-2-like [Phragmites australis]
MAAQTHSAVDSLLGILSRAITNEAKLLGAVHGDVQFIKDEMDSMNGFLLHLTKTDSEHDDQLRAWMKQVRDIAYIAEDCIEIYLRDMAPPDGDSGGLWASLRHLPVLLWTAPACHRLAAKIRELKVRVRDVGERRLRYGVTVPGTTDVKRTTKPPGQDNRNEEKMRDDFLRALEEEVTAMKMSLTSMSEASICQSFSKAIDLLPPDLPSEADATIRPILEKCSPGDVEFKCRTMFLRALFAYPPSTKQELENLKKKLEERADEPRELVMIFCYRKLSTQQKSCLQYLTAFHNEKVISRTSMVRRWVAEGLLGKEHERTPEEAGERCFSELLFRGFVRPVGTGDTGTVKSCVMDESVKDFILKIAKSENFVADSLPAHLDRQLQIRKIVQLPRPGKQQVDHWRNIRNLCGGGTSRLAQDGPGASDSTSASDVKDPMDMLLEFLKSLPEIYRLNVLDLGGCRGLKKRHLKSISKVISLKYLSLRDTDVSRLPARYIQALRLLETLDIRETNVEPSDMKHIFLPKLKHLLAGRRLKTSGGTGDTSTVMTSAEVSLSTVEMPRRIGGMTNMETLCHVQVSNNGTELEGVVKLQRLRKLGLVVHGNDNTTKYLGRVINGLAECLRSLSIWVTDGGALDISMQRVTSFSASSLILENLDIKGKTSLPSWLQELRKLANITLSDTQLKDEDQLRLGNLQGLRCLRIRRNSYSERVVNFMEGQFKALKILAIEGDTITRIVFAAGAAPNLEKIVWTFGRTEKQVPSSGLEPLGQAPISGIEYLENLRVVEITGDGFDQQQLLELDRAIAAHPNFRDIKYLRARDVIVAAE